MDLSARHWGTTPAEERETWRCAELVGEPALVRAVTVRADPCTAWRWVRQLRVAPYSYDLVDNLGRRSPRRLTPDLEPFAPGQVVMVVFEVAEVGDHEVTLVRRPDVLRRLGPVAMTYAVRADPSNPSACRLVGTLSSTAGSGHGPLSRVVGLALAWGDLVMMRKQLRTLAAYAGREAGR